MKALKVFRIPAMLALTFIACGEDEEQPDSAQSPEPLDGRVRFLLRRTRRH
jgi:hypothetical protein